jgi:hypothetical protein
MATLTYFGTAQESWLGLLRGATAFVCLAVLDRRRCTYLVGCAVAWILVASAVAVQLPPSLGDAAVYAALVGLVVFGSMGADGWGRGRLTGAESRFLLAWGTAATTLSGVVTYVVAHAAGWYPSQL